MNSIRQDQTREYIEEKHVVTIRELQALHPEVSLMTIHRDLDVLEQMGVIVKVRGGARSVRHTGDPGYEERLRENNAAKAAIADKALSLIPSHSTVFLDASTTTLMLARKLPDMDVNVFTNAPNIALELCRLLNPSITLCCGTINRKNMAISGQITLDMLENINIDLAFIGVSGCSVEAGFTCGTERDMLVKRKIIQKARTSVILCDRAKFTRLMPYTFARFSDVDYVISDGAVPEGIRSALEQSGVKLL
ncbi:MAG: DeoR/GlpR transcriptional regulator [Oscillospiraceae bacterium]|nr:DeoR/GlpR transcriptional regulator [Oscillospiraceae bacterium]